MDFTIHLRRLPTYNNKYAGTHCVTKFVIYSEFLLLLMLSMFMLFSFVGNKGKHTPPY